MKLLYRMLASAVVGAGVVAVAFWVFESVVPQWSPVPFEASRIAMLIAVLGTATAVARWGFALEAASFLAASGAVWALHEARPLSVCDLSYRPCSVGEIGSMALPVAVLLVSAGVLFVHGHTRRRRWSWR